MRGGLSNTPPEITGYRGMPLDAVPLSQPKPELRFGLHWLAASLDENPYFSVSDLFLLVKEAFDTDLVKRKRGLNGYKTCYEGVAGVKICLDPGAANQPIAHLIIPGDACETLGLEAIQKVVCCDYLRLTRLDLAFDYGDFTPWDLLRSWHSGDVRTRCHRDSFNADQNSEGSTVYLGSQAASQYICCYDKRGYTRLELRLQGERAEKTKSVLFESPDDIKQTALGILCNMVEFVDASADSNISRAPRLAWWDAFLEGVKRIVVKLDPRPAFDFSRTKKWLKNTVAPSLATYLACTSLQELAWLISDGIEKAEKSTNLQVHLSRARRRKLNKLGRRGVQDLLFNLPYKGRFASILQT